MKRLQISFTGVQRETHVLKILRQDRLNIIQLDKIDCNDISLSVHYY